MLFQKKAGVQWLVAGLGNPGQKYEETRHNVGWRALDALAEETNTPVVRLKFHAQVGTCRIGENSVLLMKPLTYMNLSGQAVAEAARFYKVPADHVLVLSDDVSLPAGKLRIRRKGSAGGHNGLKNIIQQLGTDEFPRVKIGVGSKPDPDYDMVEWVLGKFPPEEKKTMEDAVAQAAKAAMLLILEGPERAMSAYN